MSRADFIVRHDYQTETENDLVQKILVALFHNPLKYNKPVKVGLFGDSGEGKGTSYLSIATALLNAEGIDIKQYLQEINAYTPMEYMEKLDSLLHEKKLKKVKMFGVHEARVLVSSKDWQNFTTQAVNSVNAMSRSIKPLAFFIVSQFPSDITKDTRKTLNYIIFCDRPIGNSTRIYISKVWHDNRDIENIKIRTRKVRGIIVTPKGRRIPFMPQFIQLRLPEKEVMQQFNRDDTLAKKHLLKNLIEKSIQSMKARFDMENSKVSGAVDFYVKNPDMLSKIGKVSRGRFKINDEVKIMHDFTNEEKKRFGDLLAEKIKKSNLSGEEE